MFLQQALLGQVSYGSMRALLAIVGDNAQLDSRILYAPETLKGYVLLLLVPAIIVCALWPLLRRFLDKMVKLKPVHGQIDKDIIGLRAAMSYPGYRISVLIFIYGLLLLWITDFGMHDWGFPHRSAEVIVYTKVGLQAAAAFLFLPALALCFTGALVCYKALDYGHILRGTRMLSVVWCFSGFIGCLIAAGAAACSGESAEAVAGDHLALYCLAIGIMLLILGFLLRRSVIRHSNDSGK